MEGIFLAILSIHGFDLDSLEGEAPLSWLTKRDFECVAWIFRVLFYI